MYIYIYISLPGILNCGKHRPAYQVNNHTPSYIPYEHLLIAITSRFLALAGLNLLARLNGDSLGEMRVFQRTGVERLAKLIGKDWAIIEIHGRNSGDNSKRVTIKMAISASEDWELTNQNRGRERERERETEG